MIYNVDMWVEADEYEDLELPSELILLAKIAEFSLSKGLPKSCLTSP